MNIQEKLFYKVYLPYNVTSDLQVRNMSNLNTVRNGGDYIDSVVKLENAYVLTGEELLAIKKQWASEAWDKLISSLIDLKAHTPGKQAFIDNLTL